MVKTCQAGFICSSASWHGRGCEETDEPSARPHTSVSPSHPKMLGRRKHFPIPSVHTKIHPSEQQEPRARVTSHRGKALQKCRQEIFPFWSRCGTKHYQRFSFQPLISASHGRCSRGGVHLRQPAGKHEGLPQEKYVMGIAEGYWFIELQSRAGSRDIARN